MYICQNEICDPCCDFCWYCIHGEYGEPLQCPKTKPDFNGGIGYCNEFRCRIHEDKPSDIG